MREPIRILQVVSHMDRAGTETMLMNLYRNIDREIIQFDFMMDNKNEADYDNEILALGGKVYYVPKFKIYNYFSYKKAWNEFFKDHKEHKIIHGHIGSAAAIYLKMAKKEGIYTIAHSHNNNYNKNLRGFVLSLVVKPTKYIADYFFGCSYEAGLIRYGKKVVNSNKFKVLNNSIETNKYNYDEINREKIRTEFNIKSTDLVVGNVARFHVQKNHKFLIEIFEEIVKQNKNAKLLLVGVGDLQASIKNMVVNKGLEKNVIFAGLRSDIPNLLSAMDVFLLPSLYEGLGIVLIEAQANGLQCIASDTVAKEADVTERIKFISLDTSAKKWSDVVLANIDRYSNGAEKVKEKGFEIGKIAKEMQSFYVDAYKKWCN